MRGPSALRSVENLLRKIAIRFSGCALHFSLDERGISRSYSWAIASRGCPWCPYTSRASPLERQAQLGLGHFEAVARALNI